MTPEQLKKIGENMSDEDHQNLVEMRGGCSCHISPPCNNHVEPLTEEEAEDLGLLEPVATLPAEVRRKPSTSTTDYMKAVRDLCKGV